MDLEKEIYPGGFFALVRDFETRRKPYLGAAEVLPAEDVDLDALLTQTVPPPDAAPEDFPKGDFRAKQAELHAEFAGQSGLLLLQASVIAVLRRGNPPNSAPALFQRLWVEHGKFLADELNVRWKISAATTFADHGASTEQRSLGLALSILFDTIKLHDSERRLSGRPGRKPFRRDPSKKRYALAFDMEPYSFKKGDLDRNMLARLWSLAEKDDVIFPLAKSMLFLVMTDSRSVFARTQRIKRRRSGPSLLDLLPDD